MIRRVILTFDTDLNAYDLLLMVDSRLTAAWEIEGEGQPFSDLVSLKCGGVGVSSKAADEKGQSA